MSTERVHPAMAAFIAGVAAIFTTVISVMWQVAFGRSSLAQAANLIQSNLYMFVMHTIIVSFQVLGGYYAAWLSRDRLLFSALGVGAICSVYSLLQESLTPIELPLWSIFASVVLPIPACLLGAALRKRAA